jgi:hypothetical protein
LLELAEAGMINYTYSEKEGEEIEVLKRIIRDNIEFLTEAGYGPVEEDWKHI